MRDGKQMDMGIRQTGDDAGALEIDGALDRGRATRRVATDHAAVAYDNRVEGIFVPGGAIDTAIDQSNGAGA